MKKTIKTEPQDRTSVKSIQIDKANKTLNEKEIKDIQMLIEAAEKDGYHITEVSFF